MPPSKIHKIHKSPVTQIIIYSITVKYASDEEHRVDLSLFFGGQNDLIGVVVVLVYERKTFFFSLQDLELRLLPGPLLHAGTNGERERRAVRTAAQSCMKSPGPSSQRQAEAHISHELQSVDTSSRNGGFTLRDAAGNPLL